MLQKIKTSIKPGCFDKFETNLTLIWESSFK